jgi:JAB domain-containing protein similar to deubiquitination enzymes
MSFFEVCKMLISTDAFHKEGTPHVTVTAIDFYTQKNPVAVEFDYAKVYGREDKYHDIVGFYHTHPSGMNRMSQTDVNTMVQWVKCLGKTLLCLIETDQKVNGWLFTKDDKGEVTYRDVQINTANDVNYDVWLDASVSFWNPADFLLEGEYFGHQHGAPDSAEDGEDVIENMMEKMETIEKKVDILTTGFNGLLTTLQKLMEKASE